MTKRHMSEDLDHFGMPCIVESATGKTPFESELAKQAALEADVALTGEALKSFPRLPNGLVPDEVRSTSQYREAKSKFDAAFTRLRNFNQVFVKEFSKDLRDLRDARRKSGQQS